MTSLQPQHKDETAESSPCPTSTRSFALLMWLALAVMMVIIVLSAYLRLAAAGLGCSPWPDCFGHTVEGIAHTAATPHSWAHFIHRLAASSLGLIIAGIVAVVLWQRPRPAHQVTIAIALLALTLMLAAIGKWTPHLRLPAVTLVNLLGGLAMLALLWRLYLHSSDEQGSSSAGTARLRLATRIGLLLLVIQLVLGGMVSAYFAGMSCVAGTECELSWAAINWQQLNPFNELPVDVSGKVIAMPLMPVLAKLHLYVGVVTLLYLGWLGVVALRRNATLRRSTTAMVLLLVTQAVLGVIAITSGLQLPLAVAHNGTAALLLLSTISLHHRARS